ncbi:MAG: hypothetical protein ABSE15_09575 [Candidatus Bathyarchaeia archaeon]
MNKEEFRKLDKENQISLFSKTKKRRSSNFLIDQAKWAWQKRLSVRESLFILGFFSIQ